MQTNVASIDWLGGRQASRVDSSSQVAPHAYQPSHSFDAAGTALDSAASCRPWEHADLLRRLATFKPSTWASKQKASSLCTEAYKLVDGSLGGFQMFKTLKKIQPTRLKMDPQSDLMKHSIPILVNITEIHFLHQPRKIRGRAKYPLKILDAA
uniref:Uncharacterized protein n=1 Tax=Arundo donax TaxID=35708 RepID=A0A0A9CUG7_ARUDO